MAAKFEEIRKALTGPLTAVVDIPIAWPNVKFDNPPTGPHAYVEIGRNQPIVATMGRDGLDAHTGSMTVNLFYPKGGTDFPLMRMADKIESEYQKYLRGNRLTSGTTSVRITSIGMGNTQSDDVWFFAPVTILYESYIKGL